MAEATGDNVQPPKKKGGLPLVPILTVLALAGGFGSTFLGLWGPGMLMSGESGPPADVPAKLPAFVAIPQITVSILGSEDRHLIAEFKLQVPSGAEKAAAENMPRISDSFMELLAAIEPVAFERRGVLEIVRTELLTRAKFILGDEGVKDVLVQEFRVQ